MISQSCEYNFTNAKTLNIMEMLSNNKEFEHFIDVKPSDIINLALNILGLLVEVHDKETTHDNEDIEIYKNLIDDNRKFANYSGLSFAVSRANNNELNELFLNICENKELSSLVKEMQAGDDV